MHNKNVIKLKFVARFTILPEGKAEKIHERILPTPGNSCPSYKTVRLWVTEFKRERIGRTSVMHAPRLKAPKSAVTSVFWDAKGILLDDY